MPAWIVHEPYTDTDGRDYRPGDTLTADFEPACDCTQIGGEMIKGREESIQVEQVTAPAPRRGRKVNVEGDI